jgi:hypothetical protein
LPVLVRDLVRRQVTLIGKLVRSALEQWACP